MYLATVPIASTFACATLYHAWWDRRAVYPGRAHRPGQAGNIASNIGSPFITYHSDSNLVNPFFSVR